MAKGQRSNRQKALRTVRRKKIGATWVLEAEKSRLEAAEKCMAAAPLPVKEPPATAEEEERGRARGEEAMAVDAQPKPSKKKAKKGVAVGQGLKVGGVGKKRKTSKARAKVGRRLRPAAGSLRPCRCTRPGQRLPCPA